VAQRENRGPRIHGGLKDGEHGFRTAETQRGASADSQKEISGVYARSESPLAKPKESKDRAGNSGAKRASLDERLNKTDEKRK